MPNHFLGESGLKSKLQRKRLSLFIVGISFISDLVLKKTCPLIRKTLLVFHKT